MADEPNPTPEKDTSDWVTGGEPMTGPQASYLQTLCQEAGEDFDQSLTKAQASQRIEELQGKTGRGGAVPEGQEALPIEDSGSGGSDDKVETETEKVAGTEPNEGAWNPTGEEDGGSEGPPATA